MPKCGIWQAGCSIKSKREANDFIFFCNGKLQICRGAAGEGGDTGGAAIVDCFRENRFAFEDEAIGVISPTYDWGLPSIVKEFLEKTSFRMKYLYFVATYGTTPGAIGAMANEAIKGRDIDAYYAVQMLDTWTPIFDLSTPEKVAKYTKHTESEIDSMMQGVRERRANRHMCPRTPAVLTKLIAEPIYNSGCGAPPISMWRIPVSAVDCVSENAPCRQSKCGRKSPSGSRRNASCASAVCTAARGLPSNMTAERRSTGSTPIRR